MTVTIKRICAILSAAVFGFLYGNLMCILEEALLKKYFIFTDVVLVAVVIYIIAAVFFLRKHYGFCLLFIAPATLFGIGATGDFWAKVFERTIDSDRAGTGIAFLFYGVLYADVFCTAVILIIRWIRRKCMEHDAMMEEKEVEAVEEEEQRKNML